MSDGPTGLEFAEFKLEQAKNNLTHATDRFVLLAMVAWIGFSTGHGYVVAGCLAIGWLFNILERHWQSRI